MSIFRATRGPWVNTRTVPRAPLGPAELAMDNPRVHTSSFLPGGKGNQSSDRRCPASLSRTKQGYPPLRLQEQRYYSLNPPHLFLRLATTVRSSQMTDVTSVGTCPVLCAQKDKVCSSSLHYCHHVQYTAVLFALYSERSLYRPNDGQMMPLS